MDEVDEADYPSMEFAKKRLSDHLQAGKGMWIFGVPVNELDRDDLIATVGFLGGMWTKEIARGLENSQHIIDLFGRKSDRG